MEKSEYEKILAGLTCPACGEQLEVTMPPIVVFRGEEYLTLPGGAECPACGEVWAFTHNFQCPNCGHWEVIPTNKCPHCGSEMEPRFDIRTSDSEWDVDFCECDDAMCLIVTSPLANPPVCPLEPGGPVGQCKYLYH